MTAHPARNSRLAVLVTGLALLAASLAQSAPSASAATTTLYVSPTGSDNATGSESAPLRTLAKAVSKATSGSTIVLRGGVYHESVQVYAKDLDIVGTLGETVVLDGARRVTGWVSTADGWYADGWTYEVANTVGDMIAPDRPMAAYPDLAFLDGEQLDQVATLAELGAGRFYVDDAADRIWIGDDPTGRTVEAGDLPFAIYFNKANGSSLKNVVVRRYATPASNMAAVRAYANSISVANTTFEDNAYIGLSAMGRDFDFTDLLVQDNAYIGVHGHHADNFSLRRSTVLRNNRERFDWGHSGSGVKVTTSTGIEFRDNYVADNLGPGLWTDLSGVNVTVVGNLLEDNLRSSIMMELSGFVTVVNNVVIGSGVTGVRILETNDSEVWNNALYRSQREIWVQDGPRTDATADEWANWDVNRTNIHNNVMAQGRSDSEALLVADDWTNNRSAWDMATVADRNAYWLPTGSVARVSKWGRSPQSAAWSTSLTQHQTQTRQDAASLWSSASTNPFARDAANYDYRTPTNVGSGIAANQRVADALGIPVGTVLPIGPLSVLSPSSVAGGPITSTPPTPPTTTPATTTPATTTPATTAPTTVAPTTSTPTTVAPTTSTPTTTTVAPVTTTTVAPPVAAVPADVVSIGGRHALTAITTTDGGTATFRAAGNGEVPNDARSVLLNVSARAVGTSGRIAAHACGATRPPTTHLRYTSDSDVTATVLADIGDVGRVCLYTSSAAVIDVDVVGFVPATSDYRSVRLARLYNSRPGYPTISGPSTSPGRITAGSVVEIPVAGIRRVPTDAAAVVLTLMSSSPSGPGTVTVSACGAPTRTAASLQVRGAAASANMVVSALGADGSICVTSTVDTHLFVHLSGWFPATSDVQALTPTRVADTRIAGLGVDGQARRAGRLAAGTTTRIPVAGLGGVPVDASAVLATVTVSGSRETGDIVVHSCSVSVPGIRTLRADTGKSATTAVVVPLVDGDICVTTAATAHLALDVTGWVD